MSRFSISLPEDDARKALATAMALLEKDCSRSWPQCPRAGLACDCRLRAINGCNALQNADRRVRR